MKKNSKSGLILAIVILVISVVLTVGVKTVFHACGVHDDGGYGSCHWAEQAVFAMGLALTAAGIILLVCRSASARAALSAAIAVQAVITALIPNIFIKLCMMPAMRCNAVMRPAVIVLSALTAVLAVVSAIINMKGSRDA